MESRSFSSEDSNDDFELIEKPYEDRAYVPQQVIGILQCFVCDQIEKGNLQFEYRDEDFLIIHSKEGKKIALFSTCYSSVPSLGDEELSPELEELRSSIKRTLSVTHNQTLEDYFQKYVNKKFSCDLLIIPIAEVVRNHFRLLVINTKLNSAQFYDSKSFFCSVASEHLCAGSFAFIAKTLGSKSSFIENYNFILNNIAAVCGKFFKNIQLKEIYPGQQSVFNYKDCGPWIVTYAALIINGEEPSTNLNIEEQRYWQTQLAKQYPIGKIDKIFSKNEFVTGLCQESKPTKQPTFEELLFLIKFDLRYLSKAQENSRFAESDSMLAFLEITKLSEAVGFFSKKYKAKAETLPLLSAPEFKRLIF
jgi:hypothetical protein